MKEMLDWKLFGVALAIRIFVGIGGSWVDSYLEGIDFTDIDYRVFTDAAKLVSHGFSPFERATYRYPPLLAMLLMPEIYFSGFGKVLFCIADAALVFEIYRFSMEFGNQKSAVFYSAFWALNGASICICARGNADSLTNYLVLLSLRLVLQLSQSRTTVFQVGVAAGAVYGFLIYMRIYPIVFAPAFLLSVWYGARSDSCKNNNALSLKKVAALTLSTCSTVAALIALSYYLYGMDYLDNALLYHLSREDHRHNFSIHHYAIYLSRGSGTSYSAVLIKAMFQWLPDASAQTCTSNIINPLIGHLESVISPQIVQGMLDFLPKLFLFFPQFLLFAAVICTFAAYNLPVCLLLQTMIFVTYNKVITAQYFTWYWCLLPVTADSLRNIPFITAVISAALWALALAWWLLQAYWLEFLGVDNFLSVWQASMIFHGASVLWIALIAYYAPRKSERVFV